MVLSIHGQVGVIPAHFHFAEIPPTVDRGGFRSREISHTDLLQWWCHQIYLFFHTPVAMGLKAPEFRDLKVWPAVNIM